MRLNGGVADAQVTEVRRLIDGLRRNPRTHPFHGRREYSDRAREVALELAGMIEAGRAADAVPLARRAVERVTGGLLHIDDSSGAIGADLRELTGLYARACAIAPPDAEALHLRLHLIRWCLNEALTNEPNRQRRSLPRSFRHEL